MFKAENFKVPARKMLLNNSNVCLVSLEIAWLRQGIVKNWLCSIQIGGHFPPQLLWDLELLKLLSLHVPISVALMCINCLMWLGRVLGFKERTEHGMEGNAEKRKRQRNGAN